jgi:hypothetical protein
MFKDQNDTIRETPMIRKKLIIEVGTYIELQEESLECLKLLFQFGKVIYAF